MENMITDQDIRKLKKVFVTKEDLRTSLTSFVTKEEHKASTDRLIKYIDYRLEPLEEFKREFKDFKDSVLKSLDFLVRAYQKLTDEHTVAFEQYSRLDGKVEDHEVRIKLLEDKRRKKPS